MALRPTLTTMLILVVSLTAGAAARADEAVALHLDGDTLYGIDLSYAIAPQAVATFDIPETLYWPALTEDDDGTLWAIRYETPAHELYRLDAAAGTALLVATLSENLESLAIDPEGRLLGAPRSGALYEVDRATGALTPLLTLPLDAIHSMASNGLETLVVHKPAGEPCRLASIDLDEGEVDDVPGTIDLCGTAMAAADAGDFWIGKFQSAPISQPPVTTRVWRLTTTGELVLFGDASAAFGTPGYHLDNLAGVTIIASSVVEVPTLGTYGLLALVLVIATTGLLAVRRSATGRSASTTRSRITLLAVLILAGSASAARAVPLGLTLDGDTLYRTDLTFASDPFPIVTFDVPVPFFWQTLTTDGDGTLWALAVDGMGRHLVHLDPTTGDAEVVALLAETLGSLEVGPDGRLLGATHGGPDPSLPTLYEIDRTTGALTMLFDLAAEGVSALASDGDELYLTHRAVGGGCRLSTVDLVTGDLADVPGVPVGEFVCPDDMAADAAGHLWLARIESGIILGFIGSEVLRINPATGDLVEVGDFGTIAPAPPGTILGNLAGITFGSAAPLAIPTLDGIGLAALALLLAGAAAVAMRNPTTGARGVLGKGKPRSAIRPISCRSRSPRLRATTTREAG